MNTPQHHDLPLIDETRLARVERAVFARIGADRVSRRRRRTLGWSIAGAAAAVLAVSAVIGSSLLTPTATPLAGEASVVESVPFGTADESMPGGSAAARDAASGAVEAGREIVSTGSATVVVDDVPAAVDAVGAAATARGGYVETVSVGAATTASAESLMAPVAPNPTTDGWVSVRVPADELDDAIADLRDVGEVTASSVSRQDVTDQAVDLRARIAAGETSVQRLTQLMAQAQSTADLLAAETALQERQATLEADRQTLASLDQQVTLSTLSVQLTPRSVPVTADPAGFGDGVVAGWNGLLATANGMLIGLGFLLPWIVVLAVVGLVVWAAVRAVRRGRRRRAAADAQTPS